MAGAGRCMLMCPTQERLRRERERRLHILEVDKHSTTESTDTHPRSSEGLAVKEYVRSAAGCNLSREEWLRPPKVLLATVDYLISVTDRKDHPWWKVYEFVDDRIRCVRQDLVIQGSEGNEAISILEKCTRFYLYAQYRLCCQRDKFDVKINSDQISHCLSSLTHLYKNHSSPSQSEMTGYMLLHNIGSNETLTSVITSHLREDPTVKLALDMNMLYLSRHYIQFFKKLKHLTPLSQCALLIHLDKFKCDCLKVIENAYGVQNSSLPMSVLSSWLGFNSQVDTQAFLTSLGVPVVGNKVTVNKRRAPQEVDANCCQYHVIEQLVDVTQTPSLFLNNS
ncbi:SAC3 domain-containing protein 1-like [Dysidea avara]|uniref:SAC3 domain-containing protein 1-like n=1 Tax=Dysidea avara TaxID=196820 RepID=UPI003325B6FC